MSTISWARVGSAGVMISYGQLEHRRRLALEEVGRQVGHRPPEVVEDQRAAGPVDAVLPAAFGDQLERLDLAVHAGDEDRLGSRPLAIARLHRLVGAQCAGVVDPDDHRQVGLLLEERLRRFEAGGLVDRLCFERLDTGRLDDGGADRVGAIGARGAALVVREQRPAEVLLVAGVVLVEPADRLGGERFGAGDVLGRRWRASPPAPRSSSRRLDPCGVGFLEDRCQRLDAAQRQHDKGVDALGDEVLDVAHLLVAVAVGRALDES